MVICEIFVHFERNVFVLRERDVFTLREMRAFVRDSFTLRETHSFWERYVHCGGGTCTLRETGSCVKESFTSREIGSFERDAFILGEVCSLWERWYVYFIKSRSQEAFISGPLAYSCWSLWECSGVLDEETSQHLVKLTTHSLASSTIPFLCFSWSQLPGRAPRIHIYTKYRLCAWRCGRSIIRTIPFSPQNRFKERKEPEVYGTTLRWHGQARCFEQSNIDLRLRSSRTELHPTRPHPIFSI